MLSSQSFVHLKVTVSVCLGVLASADALSSLPSSLVVKGNILDASDDDHQ